ncbi:MAG: hypothetical protein HYR55_13950 [Acidobacteria bacterium]|nr:hypothetical protein [Acidobacteriota bacterium]MBI3658480.1 hypothetical protein [Acidobacteriota bacterium]
MKNVEVTRSRQRLDSLFDQVKAFVQDAELQSHWAKYLCILVSGFLETSVREIYSQYTEAKSAPYIVNFVEYQLKSFQNPKMEKILDLTGMFSPEWESSLRNATKGELKDAVDSIVANRNNISHGKSVGITYATVQNYYQNVIKVVELIENQCGL